jgi:hypothetical protein
LWDICVDEMAGGASVGYSWGSWRQEGSMICGRHGKKLLWCYFTSTNFVAISHSAILALAIVLHGHSLRVGGGGGILVALSFSAAPVAGVL